MGTTERTGDADNMLKFLAALPKAGTSLRSAAAIYLIAD